MRLQSSGISLKVKFFKVRHKTTEERLYAQRCWSWPGISQIGRTRSSLLSSTVTWQKVLLPRIGGDTALFIVLQDLREFLSCKQTWDEVVGVVQKLTDSYIHISFVWSFIDRKRFSCVSTRCVQYCVNGKNASIYPARGEYSTIICLGQPNNQSCQTNCPRYTPLSRIIKSSFISPVFFPPVQGLTG